MSAIKCQQCVGPLADCCCTCGGKSIFICLRCIEQHTNRPGPHFLFGLKAAVGAAGAATEKCDMCKQLPVSELCSCSFPPMALCIGCKIVHATQNKKQHIFLPLSLKRKLTSVEALATVKRDFMQLSLAEDRLRLNLAQMETCSEAVKQRCEELCSIVEAHCAEQLTPLSHLKKALNTALEAANHKVTHSLLDTEERADNLTGVLLEYISSRNNDSLSLFKYSADAAVPDIVPLFGVDWECKLDEEGRVAPFSPSQQKSINPLDFEDAEVFIDSCCGQQDDRRKRTRFGLSFYKRHLAFLEAKETVLAQVKRVMTNAEPLEVWIRCGVGLLEEKLDGAVSSRCRSEVEKCIKRLFATATNCRCLCEHKMKLELIPKELVLKEGGEENMESQIRKKRGHSSKNSIKDPKKKSESAFVPYNAPSDLEALLDGDDLQHAESESGA